MLAYTYIIVAVVSIIITLIITPLAIRIGKLTGATSIPRDVEITRPSASDLGGIAIIIAIVIAVALSYIIYPAPFAGYRNAISGLVFGAIIISLMGFIDDRKNLGVGVKFALQLIAAIVTMSFGVKISVISNPFNSFAELGIFSYPVTALWIVGVMNAVNFVDGLDGLAPGVLSIAGISLFAICASLNLPVLAIIFLSIFGANIAFLRFNYPPARIILGNMGAYLLGYIMATASIIQPVKVSTAMVLFVPMLALGFPLMEILITVIRRTLKRKKIYQRDAEHLHHLLLSFGLPPSVVDWVFYSISFIFATLAVALSVGNRSIMIFFLAGLLLVFLVLTVKLASLERSKIKL
ncbi:undecaprenyl/decaprenyl-phosphate alpha-N-acetylglucosaminyl 1-phosphate transferase [bacterium]|nr:undecaprenyl/decaprenyl-phosphate alpha-N-acetylglucosaminyl 1-phosphate transferase [bacterium]